MLILPQRRDDGVPALARRLGEKCGLAFLRTYRSFRQGSSSTPRQESVNGWDDQKTQQRSYQ